MHLRLSQSVEAGEVLAQLDDRAERSRLAEAQAHRQSLSKQIQALQGQFEAQREVLAHSRQTVDLGVGAARVVSAKLRATPGGCGAARKARVGLA